MKIRKGVINFVDGPFNKTQQVQVEGLSGEVDSKVERYQNFGFSSHIVPVEEDGRGAECVIADLGGSDHKIVLATDDKRYRPRGAVAWGDTIVYSYRDNPTAVHDQAKQRFVLTDDDSEIYRSILKINNCKFEMKSDGAVTVENGMGCSITMNGTTLVATNGQVTITLTGNQINMSATSVSISATTINLNAQNVNL
jgi:phage gp45-like